MDKIVPYFKEAEKLLKSSHFVDNVSLTSIEEDDAKTLFIQNVLKEMDGYEFRLACHHDGSKLLETFLTEMSIYQLRVFFEKVGGSSRLISLLTHRYASHVAQTWIKLSLKKYQVSDDDDDEEEDNDNSLQPLKDSLKEISNLIINHFDTLSMDSYATHIVRLIIESWNSSSTNDSNIFSMEEKIGFKKDLLDLLERLQEDEKIDLSVMGPMNPHQGPVIQLLFKSFDADSKLDKRFQNLIIPSSVREFAKVASDLSGKYTLETFISCASLSNDSNFILDKLWTPFVSPQIMGLVSGTNSNHVIQAFIEHAPNMDLVKVYLRDIVPMGKKIIYPLKRIGILIKFARWFEEYFLKHNNKDDDGVKKVLKRVLKDYYKLLKMAFLSTDDDDDDKVKSSLFETIIHASNIPFSKNNTDLKIDNGGISLLIHLRSLTLVSKKIQSIFDNVLLSLNDNRNSQLIISLSLHPVGSRLIENLLLMPRYKESLIDCLSDGILELITSTGIKCASYVIVKVFELASIENRCKMAHHISLKRNRLVGTKFGDILIEKCMVNVWEKEGESGMINSFKKEKSLLKKKRMFSDIID